MNMPSLPFSNLDIVLCVVVLIFIVRCTVKGFVDEFFSKTAVIGGGIAAVLFFKPLSPVVAEITGSDSLSGIIAFLLIFIVVYFVIKIMQRIVNRAFENESMRNFDRALGFFLGIAEGALVSAVIVIVLTQQPFFTVEPLLADSFFVALFRPFLVDVPPVFGGFL